MGGWGVPYSVKNLKNPFLRLSTRSNDEYADYHVDSDYDDDD